MTATRRGSFVKALVDQMGLPYLWDGKGLPGEPYRGRDCSGCVTSALFEAGGPDWRASHNCQRLWAELPAPLDGFTQVGDLALYGTPDRIHHVMALLYDDDNGGDLVVIGSAGGDHTTTTQAEALRRGARVQVWGSHLDMNDFAGFRTIPWLDP